MNEQVQASFADVPSDIEGVLPLDTPPLFVVDSAIPDADALCGQLCRAQAGAVLLLDETDRPFHSIAGVLEALGGGESVIIIAPLDEATLQLGGVSLTAETLDLFPDALRRIENALANPENFRLCGRPADAGPHWFGELAAQLSAERMPALTRQI